MSIFAGIEKPTLLIDQRKAQRNILRMRRKAQELEVRFRPHFKTHQSAEIGEWFRQAGVTAITVSSVDMAMYFAAADWKDITIAFPVNWRQIDAIRQLASQVHLELLVESPETVQMLKENLPEGADLWIKIDVGAHRTGIAWDRPEAVIVLARAIASAPRLRLRGLLTHAGQTYHAGSPVATRATYQETVERMNGLRRALEARGFSSLEVSVGDTPSASLCQDFGAVDEIRPGNFVFYDAMMLAAGVCQAEDVAIAVACPVVARHPERLEMVIYGGAIHLSKDYLESEGHKVYGYIALPEGEGWGAPLTGAYLSALSQEHGILRLPPADFDRIRIGDLVCILPAHSCLTVQVMGEYRTLEGRRITTLNHIAA